MNIEFMSLEQLKAAKLGVAGALALLDCQAQHLESQMENFEASFQRLEDRIAELEGTHGEDSIQQN